MESSKFMQIMKKAEVKIDKKRLYEVIQECQNFQIERQSKPPISSTPTAEVNTRNGILTQNENRVLSPQPVID